MKNYSILFSTVLIITIKHNWRYFFVIKYRRFFHSLGGNDFHGMVILFWSLCEFDMWNSNSNQSIYEKAAGNTNLVFEWLLRFKSLLCRDEVGDDGERGEFNRWCDSIGSPCTGWWSSSIRSSIWLRLNVAASDTTSGIYSVQSDRKEIKRKVATKSN